ncbi:MAG: LamG-like jellyroll fold domain-containing protein [Chitinophagaceae bacterium]
MNPQAVTLLTRLQRCSTLLLITFLIFSKSLFSQVAPLSLRAGLKAYWSFDDTSKADFGGPGYDLLRPGTGPVFSGGKAVFQRSHSDYLKTKAGVTVNADANFTYFARYKLTSDVIYSERYFIMESSQDEHAISLGLRFDAQSNNKRSAEVYSKNSTNTNSLHFLVYNTGNDSAALKNNVYNLVVTFDRGANKYEAYLNGAKVSENIIQPDPLKPGGLVIGSFRNFSDRFWDGEIDEVAVWSRLLSSGEIMDLSTNQLKISLDKANVTSLNTTGASFTLRSHENLTAYYKIIPAASTCPNRDNLVIDAQAITVPLNNTSSGRVVSGLTANTSYKICHVAKDGADSLGAVMETYFSTAITLPLTWKYFVANQHDDAVLLQWETLNEENTDHFTVQHSGNGIDFINIGNVAAAGNTTNTVHYEFTHSTPVNGANFYRLQQVDKDGRSTYSSIVKVMVNENAAVLKLLANPVQGKQIRFQLAAAEEVSLFTQEGKLVWKKKLVAGTNTINANLFASGVYMLQAGSITRKVILE